MQPISPHLVFQRPRFSCILFLFVLGAVGWGCRSRSKDKAKAHTTHAVIAPPLAGQGRGQQPPLVRRKAKRLRSSYRWVKISAKLQPDPVMERWIAPYRKRLHSQMSKVLASLAKGFKRHRTESELGNLIADICFQKLHKMGLRVDMFVTNHGGIRTDLGAGPVTVNKTYEILPFENALVVFRVSGKVLRQMMEVIAKRGGEPIAGVRILISRTKPYLRDVKVGGKSLDSKREYFIGSSDYLTRTGWLSPFLRKKSLYLTGLTLRGVFQWGLKTRVIPLVPRLDGRVTLVKR